MFSERLRFLREEAGLKQSELATILGIGRTTLSHYELGNREPDLETLRKIGEYFKVSLDYLLGKDNNRVLRKFDDKLVKIPVMNHLSENDKNYLSVSSEFINEDKDYFYVRITNDSMNIYFDEGSTVVIEKQNCIGNNEIAVLLINNLDVTVRKIVKNNNFITLIPCSTNAIYQSEMYDMKKDNIKILGKVIMAIKKF